MTTADTALQYIRKRACRTRNSDWIRGRELLLGAVALFLLLSIAYAFSVDIRATRGASITGDEPYYLLTTQSLLDDGDFDLRNQYATKSYKSFFDHPNDLWLQSVPTKDDGRLLSPHNPGLSLLVIPGFALGGLAGVQVQLLVLAAATMALAFVLAARLSGHWLVSWVVALIVGLTATAFIYSTEIYPEFPAALTLVISLLLVTRRCEESVERNEERDPSAAPFSRLTPMLSLLGRACRTRSVADGLMLAAALTAMCWLGVKYAPLALLVSGYFLLKSDWAGRIALVIAGTVSAIFFAWFHLNLFGSLTPYSVAVVYAGWSTTDILGGHVEFGERYYRLWGLFIDRRFGIGRWAPLLLAVVPGMALLAVRVPRFHGGDVIASPAASRVPTKAGTSAQRMAGLTHVLTLALILVQMVIATFVAITMMGWWFPGRTLLTALPLFVLPICLFVVRVSLWGRIAVGLLGALTLATTYGLATAGRAREVTIAVDPFDMAFSPFQGLAGIFPLYTLWTTETWWLTIFWLAVAVLVIGATVWAEVQDRFGRDPYHTQGTRE